MRSIILYILFAIGLVTVFYFSWIPQPRLGLTHYLPVWLSHWTDEDANMNLRTAIPFVFLGSLQSVWLIRSKQPWRNWIAAWLVSVAVVTIAEIGQLVLPLRHFDWGDIAWGAAGAAAGMFFFLVLSLCAREVRALF